MTAMPDRSEGEPPEGGAVDDGWGELLGDGDSAPSPPEAEASSAEDAARGKSKGGAGTDDADGADGEAAAADDEESGAAAAQGAAASSKDEPREKGGQQSKQLTFAPPGAMSDIEESKDATGEEAEKKDVAGEAEQEEDTAGEAEAAKDGPDEAKEAAGDTPTRDVPADAELPRVAAESASSEGGSSWGFVGALVVAAALVGAWVLSTRNGDAPAPSPENRTPKVAGDMERADRSPRADRAVARKASAVALDAQDTQPRLAEPPKEPEPPVPEEPPPDPDPAKEAPAKEAIPKPSDSSGDPRAVPAGTPPEIAKVFEDLPATPTDRPPVGKVGKSGIHIDRISMGTEYKSGRCGGQPDGFSISKRQRANVCFRVVHDRQEEEVRVLWQRDGGTMRRSKLKVPAAHAYRTRAFLVLRKEYAGRWTVRIMSADGIELAAHAFSVVE
jgi:hypothetical protein